MSNEQTAQTLELEVEGLCCTECAMSLEKALKRCPGVVDYEFLFAAEKATVRYKPKQIEPSDIEQAIVKVGYPVRNLRLVQAEVTPSEETRIPSTVELTVEGLCCTECAMGIESAFKRLQGITHHDFLFGPEKAVVSFDSSQVTLRELEYAIHSAGYRVTNSRILKSKFPTTDSGATCPDVNCGCALPVSNAENVTEKVRVSTKRKTPWNSIRFWLVTVISVVVLGELVGESLGWLNHLTQIIPHCFCSSQP